MDRISFKKLIKKFKVNFINERVINIASVLGLIIIWYGISMFVKPIFLPSPLAVFIRTYSVYGGSEIIQSILNSLLRIFAGLIIGSIVGFSFGVAISWNKKIEWWFEPLIELLRPVPIVAVIPLFILWFGLGEVGKILLIAFGCFVRQIVSTHEAIKNVPTVYLKAAQTLGATRKSKIFGTIIIPSITPEIIGGLRVTVAAAFGYCAAAEFLGAQSGLGYMIIVSRRYLYTFGVIFGIIVFGILALGTDYFVRYADRKINAWTERESK